MGGPPQKRLRILRAGCIETFQTLWERLGVATGTDSSWEIAAASRSHRSLNFDRSQYNSWPCVLRRKERHPKPLVPTHPATPNGIPATIACKAIPAAWRAGD